jgi:hypothetical protein
MSINSMNLAFVPEFLRYGPNMGLSAYVNARLAAGETAGSVAEALRRAGAELTGLAHAHVDLVDAGGGPALRGDPALQILGAHENWPFAYRRAELLLTAEALLAPEALPDPDAPGAATVTARAVTRRALRDWAEARRERARDISRGDGPLSWLSAWLSDLMSVNDVLGMLTAMARDDARRGMEIHGINLHASSVHIWMAGERARQFQDQAEALGLLSEAFTTALADGISATVEDAGGVDAVAGEMVASRIGRRAVIIEDAELVKAVERSESTAVAVADLGRAGAQRQALHRAAVAEFETDRTERLARARGDAVGLVNDARSGQASSVVALVQETSECPDDFFPGLAEDLERAAWSAVVKATDETS